MNKRRVYSCAPAFVIYWLRNDTFAMLGLVELNFVVTTRIPTMPHSYGYGLLSGFHSTPNARATP